MVFRCNEMVDKVTVAMVLNVERLLAYAPGSYHYALVGVSFSIACANQLLDVIAALRWTFALTSRFVANGRVSALDSDTFSYR